MRWMGSLLWQLPEVEVLEDVFQRLNKRVDEG